MKPHQVSGFSLNYQLSNRIFSTLIPSGVRIINCPLGTCDAFTKATGRLKELSIVNYQNLSSGVIFSMSAGEKDGRAARSVADVMGPERRRREMMSRAWV